MNALVTSQESAMSTKRAIETYYYRIKCKRLPQLVHWTGKILYPQTTIASNVKRKKGQHWQAKNVTPCATKSIEFAEFSSVVVPVGTNPNPNPNLNYHYSVAAVIISDGLVKHVTSFHILA